MFRKREFAIISEITRYIVLSVPSKVEIHEGSRIFNFRIERARDVSECAARPTPHLMMMMSQPGRKIAARRRIDVEKFMTFAVIKATTVSHNYGERPNAIITGTQHCAALLRAAVAPTSPSVLAPRRNYSDRTFCEQLSFVVAISRTVSSMKQSREIVATPATLPTGQPDTL